ncbi:MAG: ATP-dependent helicase, partial [Pirellulales bacterium]|nr:ATP-dependent helicase [Pirellulales bacterium]
MAETSPVKRLLSALNPQQQAAVTHGRGPLLIVAGAGTGKTATLVHRVAWLITQGVDPGRILLLTFTRRAAAEMLRRTDGALRQLSTDSGRSPSSRVWGGTFHAIATRLLRRHGKAIGLVEGFSIHDRGDSEDLMNVVRTTLGMAKTDRRFPKKGTCMAIYSRCVNSRAKLGGVLKKAFPWCGQWEEELKQLFDAYVDRKESLGVLDYDDLLLYWHALLADDAVGPSIRGQFDCVLVDEYQDTNRLQAEIVYQLRPDGQGLTVVGDDAQSIYSFRAATVRNILDLPKRYADATLLTLEQNYRSSTPILEATNRVIGQAKERFTKNLWSERSGGQRPRLVTCEDEEDQTEYLIEHILEHREEGIDLRRQAVLFRASHHSITLEAELARRDIPFHKYGGLKFVETAHIKDLLAFLRLAENPRDVVAGLRVLPLLPGIGPGRARTLMDQVAGVAREPFAAWAAFKPPEAARGVWPGLVELMGRLTGPRRGGLPEQVHRVRTFYAPLLEQV